MAKKYLKNPKAEEFYLNYSKNVVPIFEKFESMRLHKIFKLAVIFVFFVFISFFIYKVFNSETNLVSIMIALLAVGYAIILYFIITNFTTDLKLACMEELLKVFGDIYWSSKDGKDLVSEDEIKECGLFSVYNRRSDDDIFEGEYKDVEFTILETNLAYIGNKQYYTVFDGVIIKFPCNKVIKNQTIITTRGDVNVLNKKMMLKRIGICMSIFSLFQFFPFLFAAVTGYMSTARSFFIQGCCSILIFLPIVLIILFFYFRKSKNDKVEALNEIVLEDPEFTKNYVVYSSDEIEGRYLITPVFMERFKNLTTAFGVSNAKCSFYGDEIMFALSTRKNLFEIGNMFISLKNPKQINNFYKEISSILNMIDYFKLDEKTGL